MGVNASGLRSKFTTFRKVISDLSPSVFFIQETKMPETGKKICGGYSVFELVRKSPETKTRGQAGGGLALWCLTDLKPVRVRDGGTEVEALSVNITVQKMIIRCVVAYGCQESDIIVKKNRFWSYLDEDVSLAEADGAGFILQFDGNLWCGSGMIPGDPRPQNKNGKLFQEFLIRNNLTVVNSLELCEDSSQEIEY